MSTKLSDEQLAKFADSHLYPADTNRLQEALQPEYLGMLRRTAKAATQEKWWVTEQPWGDGLSVHAGPSEDPHLQRLSVCMFDVMSEQFNSAFDGVDCDDIEAEGRRNMRHIAVFDPPTCIEILETMDKLYLEISQFTEARTAKELKLRAAVVLLNSMVESGERHSEQSRQVVREALQ